MLTVSAPSHEAAAAAGAGDDGAADAVGEGDGVLAVAHEAARAVAGSVDGHSAHAVLHGDAAEEVADESARAFVIAGVIGVIAVVDAARDGEVAEGGGARHYGEGRDELLVDGLGGCAILHGQRVALAVERALELGGAAAHACDGDVGAEADGLAAERLAGLLQVAEEVPVCGGLDATQGEAVVVEVVVDVGEGCAAVLEVVGHVADGDSGYDGAAVVPAFGVDVWGVERLLSPAVEADVVADVERAEAVDGAVGVGGDVHIAEGDRAVVVFG